MDGSFKGAVPESMKTVDSLAGVKEGKGGIGDTVYIIIDPRCPYCREAYNLTRAYAAKGHSIKWIPSAALGNPEDGVPLAALSCRPRTRKRWRECWASTSRSALSHRRKRSNS